MAQLGASANLALMVSYGGRIRVYTHKVTFTSTHVKVMTTSHYILKVAMPGNAPLIKERFINLMMRIGDYMHRIKLVLLCACI